jgi:uncharacterized peroxidase-related enzyme
MREDSKMAYINTVSAHEADGKVLEMYEHFQGNLGYVPNYATLFSHRPEVMQLWSDLLYGVRRNMDKRRFELVTLAAAMAVRSTYCSLAHGKALTEYFGIRDVIAIAEDAGRSPLDDAESAMVKFARKVARDASSVSADEVEELKAHGFDDAEIFDIAAVAAARTFFAQLCEGLGAIGDHGYSTLDPRLRQVLSVGRPIEFTEPEKVGRMHDMEVACG